MKRIIILFYLSVSWPFIFAQETTQVEYLLNGKKVNFDQVFINPHNIESIYINKESQPYEIQITTKTKEWESISLDKFLKIFSPRDQLYLKLATPIFIVDDQVIEYPDSIKIDSTYYGEVKFQSLSNIKDVPWECKNLTLVRIKLSGTPIIHLRGNEIEIPDRLKQ
jgi:hypothetical protein